MSLVLRRIRLVREDNIKLFLNRTRERNYLENVN
jgi:hypothetical protein